MCERVVSVRIRFWASLRRPLLRETVAPLAPAFMPVSMPIGGNSGEDSWLAPGAAAMEMVGAACTSHRDEVSSGHCTAHTHGVGSTRRVISYLGCGLVL
eukprot:3142172-Rhodomonas_salina.1